MSGQFEIIRHTYKDSAGKYYQYERRIRGIPLKK